MKDEKTSRGIAEKVHIKAKEKLEEMQFCLQQYQAELNDWRLELEEREEAICICQQTAIPPPKLRPLGIPLCDLTDCYDDNEDIDFDACAQECYSQLLVSHANASSINLALNDLVQKGHVSDLRCLHIVMKCTLSYLKSQSLLGSPEKRLRDLLKVFDGYMPPESRLESELVVLDQIEVFYTGSTDCPLELLKCFYKLDILHTPSLLEWAYKHPGIGWLDPWIQEISTTSVEAEWELDYTVCRDDCDCDTICNRSSTASLMSSSTAVEEEFKEEACIEKHCLLKWSTEKAVREFSDEELYDHIDPI